MKRAVLFDMDGVLVDTEPIFAVCLQEALHKAGIDLPLESFYRFTGLEFTEKFNAVAKERDVTLDFNALTIAYRAAQMDRLADFAPLLKQGARETLLRLRERGWMTALCSNSLKSRVGKVLHDTELDGMFNVIVSGEQVPNRKPDPGIYLLAMERIGLPPTSCVAVEDSIYGIQAAKAANLRVIVLRDSRFPYVEGSADQTIEQFVQLDQALEELL